MLSMRFMLKIFMGSCPSLVVAEVDSCLRGREFASQHGIRDE